jgi:integrase
VASIGLDKKTRWWSVRYFAGVGKGRIKKTLCKHEGPIPRPGKTGRVPIPHHVQRLADPFVEAERKAKTGQVVPEQERTDFARYVSQYMEAYRQNHPEKTAKYTGRTLGIFVEFCAGQKVTHLQGITPGLCRAWLTERGKSVKRSTLKSERGFITPLFSQARNDKLIRENPWEFVKVGGKDRDERPTFWTRAELDQLVAETDGWHRDAVLLAANTGIRIAALLSLKWGDVDWDRGEVKVRASTSKSGRPYEVPMSAVCRQVLAQRLDAARRRGGGGPNELVIENPKTGKRYSTQASYLAIERAVKRAGIPDHGDFNHVLRRTFATLAIDQGKPLVVVSRWLGHASITTTQKYLGFRTEDTRGHMEDFSLGGKGEG